MAFRYICIKCRFCDNEDINFKVLKKQFLVDINCGKLVQTVAMIGWYRQVGAI